MHRFNYLLFTLLILGIACPGSSKDVHKCSGAGFWFPSDPATLKKDVDRYMEEAPPRNVEGKPVALISPHAGYRLAGPVMGAAYRHIKGKSYKRVIILAFSHSFGGFRKISVLPVDSYETPLGGVPVDRETAENLLKHTGVFTSIPNIHKREHSDENQLPFLQRTLKEVPIVSLYVDRLDPETMKKAVQILLPYLDGETLFVASTDLNHYGDAYGYAPFGNLKGKRLVDRIHEHDREALKYMEEIDPGGFRSYIAKTGATVCGRQPVELLLRLLSEKGNLEGRIMHYYTSADRDGDHARQTCGYGSVVYTFSGENKKPKKEKVMKEEEKEKKETGEPDPPILSKDEQQTLLKLARDTLEGITKDKSYKPEIARFDITDNLKEKSRLFVTLTKNGKLRGCIGHVTARMPICQAVIDNTWNACFEDPRFPPVKAGEVADIRIEISINTPQRLIKDASRIQIGKHGLILEKGWHRGLLLPQVPVEWNWNRDQFLDAICRKAGLPPGSWKDPEARLYIYSSQVFHEEKL